MDNHPTYQQFTAQVVEEFPSADWGFKDQSPRFTECPYNPGRVLYEWQEGFSFVTYDSTDSPNPWRVEVGRGSQGSGATLAEALANEKQNYAPNSYRE